MKILISAYSCETGRGSEGEIGWRVVNSLAKQHNVRVITRANLKDIHDASYSEYSKPKGLQFEYFDLPWIFRFYKKGERGFLLYYYLWQIGVGLKAWMLLRNEPADIIHHLIGGMDWMPAGLACCPRALGGPFIWGPVGSEDTNLYVLRHQPPTSRFKNLARSAIRWCLRTLDPFTRFTGARADIVLSHTPESLPKRYFHKMQPFIQTGIAIDENLVRRKKSLARGDRLRLVFAGDLKDWKGARIALEASLILFESNGRVGEQAELTVIGDGPLRAEMEVMAKSHPQGEQVRFLGRIPMEQLVEELQAGDIFLYPSFHHGLATIVLQAMSTGLPVICIEGDATGRTVGQEAGITISPSKAEPPAIGIARALIELANDEPRRLALAQRAQVIAYECHDYDKLAARIADTYSSVIESYSC